jgi:hypothetical protein
MYDYPKLATPIILAILMAICLIAAKDIPRLPEWVRTILIVVGGIMGVFAILSLYNWLAYSWAHRLEDINRAKAATAEVMIADRRLILVREIANMPMEKILAMANFIGPPEKWIMGNTGPIPVAQFYEDNVPIWFITKFWELSDDEYLVPIRTWGDGTRERRWAEEITRYLISFGLASPAAGNLPAKWVSVGDAHKWLFGTNKGL